MVVIGSGPTALACLDGLADTNGIALITGVTAATVPLARLHPKIQSVATERNEPAGVAELFETVLPGAKPLFSTAVVGGLANYWGQQFVRMRRSEPWPHQLFGNYADYETEAGLIERRFMVEGDARIATNLLGSDYVSSTPRLLAGTRDNPTAGLEAMRLSVSELAGRDGVRSFPARATRIARHGTQWAVHLDTGQSIITKRVLVAAGVIGSARLLMRSFADLTGFQFDDHSPWMLYAFGLRRLVFEANSRDHFNAMSIEKVVGEEASCFASLYDMGRADLSLILSSLIGRNWPRLRTWRAPPGASLFTPVQVWTSTTTDQVQVTAEGGVSALYRPVDAPLGDNDLADFIDVLGRLGGRVLKIGRTRPGAGFHYHSLRLQTASNLFEVGDFLSGRTGGEVVCADASILPKIGCRPHTLTAMASARRIASRLISP